jgi:hypothetical protein
LLAHGLTFALDLGDDGLHACDIAAYTLDLVELGLLALPALHSQIELLLPQSEELLFQLND